MRGGVLMQTCHPSLHVDRKDVSAFGRTKLDVLIEREHDSFCHKKSLQNSRDLNMTQ